MSQPVPRAELSRQIHFSSGRKIGRSDLSEAENRRLYGELFVSHGLGNNFILEATVQGPVDPSSGMVLNLRDLDAHLKAVTDPLDHHFLNEDISYFQSRVPTSEALAHYLFVELEMRLPGADGGLTRLRLSESDQAWVECFSSDPEYPMLLTHVYPVSALHRHHNPDLSAEENERLFYKCSRIHGHQYHFEVTVRGKLDPVTGLIADRNQMDELIQREIVKRFHGSFLNDYFGNTSGEIIAAKTADILQSILPGQFFRLKLRETRKNSFVVVAS